MATNDDVIQLLQYRWAIIARVNLLTDARDYGLPREALSEIAAEFGTSRIAVHELIRVYDDQVKQNVRYPDLLCTCQNNLPTLKKDCKSLLDLPDGLVGSIMDIWLTLRDVAEMDRSVCCHDRHISFCNALRLSNVWRKEVQLRRRGSGDYLSSAYVHWLYLRGVPFQTAFVGDCPRHIDFSGWQATTSVTKLVCGSSADCAHWVPQFLSYCPHLQSLHLRRCHIGFTDHVLRSAMKHCPHMTEVELSPAFHNTFLTYPTQETLAEIEAVQRAQQNVAIASFAAFAAHFRNIRKFVMSSSPLSLPHLLEVLSTHCPSLQEMRYRCYDYDEYSPGEMPSLVSFLERNRNIAVCDVDENITRYDRRDMNDDAPTPSRLSADTLSRISAIIADRPGFRFPRLPRCGSEIFEFTALLHNCTFLSIDVCFSMTQAHFELVLFSLPLLEDLCLAVNNDFKGVQAPPSPSLMAHVGATTARSQHPNPTSPSRALRSIRFVAFQFSNAQLGTVLRAFSGTPIHWCVSACENIDEGIEEEFRRYGHKKSTFRLIWDLFCAKEPLFFDNDDLRTGRSGGRS